MRRGLLIALVAGALAALGAAPAQAFMAYTGEVSPGLSTATVYGYLDTSNLATQWVFAYGPTTSYGYWSSPGTISAGQGTVMVAAQLTGLRPGALYHYRLVAVPVVSSRPLAAWVTIGSDQWFRTRRVQFSQRRPRSRARPRRASAHRSR